LQVSEETIRRDLKELQAQGLVRKTHGGALRRTPPPTPYESRVQHAPKLKVAIGQAAASLVEDGESILIDSGTTALALARSLAAARGRVVTNSLEVAKVISQLPQYELILIGGRWDPLHQFVGAAAVEQLSRYRVDKLFLGIAGLDAKLGLTAPSDEEAAVKRAMIQAAREVIGLADHTKVGEVAFAHVAAASVLDVLVTDEMADLTGFRSTEWKVMRVRVSEDQSL
jgi:DeoR family transcriptional regulator of aga operon/DeoR family fructose operon transcriptional repressor